MRRVARCSAWSTPTRHSARLDACRRRARRALSVDLLIHGGVLVDGLGSEPHHADVAVVGERIRALTAPGALDPGAARAAIDATGHVVAPGFVDVMSHSEASILRDPRSSSKVRQGVTTEIIGELFTPTPPFAVADGGAPQLTFGHHLHGAEDLVAEIASWRHHGDWLHALELCRPAVNVATLVGGGSLRGHHAGWSQDPLSAAQLAAAGETLADAMQAGAFGLASALIYPPDNFWARDELVALCSVVAQHGGVWQVHVRDEAARLHEALDEVIEIGRRSGAPVHVFHLKSAGGPACWGLMPTALQRLADARAAGQDISCDMYPYDAAMTLLSAVLPPWAAAPDGLLATLIDPRRRAAVREATLTPDGTWEAVGEIGADRIVPRGLRHPDYRAHEGESLAAIATWLGADWVDTAIELILHEGDQVLASYHEMSEDNLRLQMTFAGMMFGSDGAGLDPEWAAGFYEHPRAYGYAARVLGRYVREQGVLSLTDAVERLSRLPADRFGLASRGRLAAGCFADIVVFDESGICDRSDFAHPHRFADGVRDVVVNGSPALVAGQPTDQRSGHVLRRGTADL